MATNNVLNAPIPFSVSNGGTGASTLTLNGILLGNGTSAITPTAALTDGQILIGDTGGVPVLSTITAGTGISVTNGAGSITIASTATAFAWSIVTAATPMVAGNGYFAAGALSVVFTLPATATLGDTFWISYGGQPWSIAQNASQLIQLGNQQTTAGVTGGLTSTTAGDAIQLVYRGSDTFHAISWVGNLTVV